MKQALPPSRFLDVRNRTALGAIVAVESGVARLRPGAHRVVVRVDERATIEALRDWAEDLDIPFEFRATASEIEVHLYLLPATFDAHVLDSPRRERALSGSGRTPVPLLGR